MKKIAILGCVHADFSSVRDFIGAHPDVSEVVCLGDFGFWFSQEEAMKDTTMWRKCGHKVRTNIDRLNSSKFKTFSIPVHFITGNHDQYDYTSDEVSKLKDLNIFPLPRVGIITKFGINIAILSGIFSPVKFEWELHELSGRLKRFYTRTDLPLLRNNDKKHISLFLTHEAAKGVMPTGNKSKNRKETDQGTWVPAYILDILKPDYYMHAHHHINYKHTGVNDTEIYGLGLLNRDKSSHAIITVENDSITSVE